MAAQIAGMLDDGLSNAIKKSKVLVVGAGGIGCEVLKNLVMSGFGDIEIIDMDTIDVSNLNRQFLFHKEHVGKSKSEVARESALSFNPNVNIKAHHGSIISTKYGMSFYQLFSVVLNALDNPQARNHVNRMCLTAGIPLIESGTAGYNGQVELIKKGLTTCYECTPKAVQKTYPTCTIRNTPSELIHCIVWAKHFFNLLFGGDEEISPDTSDEEAGGKADAEGEKLAEEKPEPMDTGEAADKCLAEANPEKLFNRFFNRDIKTLLSMSDLWKNRKPPTPMEWQSDGDSDDQTRGDDGDSIQITSNGAMRDQVLWSIAECKKVFAQSVSVLHGEYKALPNGDILVWDKDNKAAMDFVAACANMRAKVFNISQKSRFDIKAMAGNIIPAIATTNAITAGMVVLHALKVLQADYENCQTVYMRLRPNPRNQIIVPEKVLSQRNPNCYVCSEQPLVHLKIDTHKMTVAELRDTVLIKTLNMVDPDVMIDGKGVIVISSDGDETECNNEKKLSDIQIVDGCILKVDDFFQKYELTVAISHKDAGRDDTLFDVVSNVSELKAQQTVTTAKEPEPGTSSGNGVGAGPSGSRSATATIAADDDDDSLDECMIQKDNSSDDESLEHVESPPLKRKKLDDDEFSAKKQRLETIDSDEDEDLIRLE